MATGGGLEPSGAHEAAKDAAAFAEARAIIAANPLLDPTLPRPTYVRPQDSKNSNIGGESGNGDGGGDGGGDDRHDDGLNAAARRAAARRLKNQQRGGGRLQDGELSQMVDVGMCLSMHQPWASLLVRGIKQHEGRTW